ncbi:hypothetical protein ACQP1G_16940 [Nocardia sp. CA-107356]|uniref:hypothetical protein n=1 Tax=Nocardia sp. CA-107356 TaxID=3239972 RepID=UPI003D90D65A
MTKMRPDPNSRNDIPALMASTSARSHWEVLGVDVTVGAPPGKNDCLSIFAVDVLTLLTVKTTLIPVERDRCSSRTEGVTDVELHG